MNVLFLIGGLLSILLSIAHALWGEKQMAKELKESGLSELTRAGFYIAYHQITAMLLINGITLLIISIFDATIGIDLVALLIAIIIIGNVSVFVLICITKHRDIFAKTLPQLILFIIMVLLVIIGIFL